QGQPQQAQRSQSSSSNVGSENIFIKTLVSKTRVHEQEAILLSYKVYWAGVELAQFTNNTKLPEYKGFLKQDLEQDEIQTQLEHYNGRNYQTAIIYQTLLYPQKAGEVKIDPAQFEAILRVQNRAQVRSIFDDFFGSYSNVAKQFTAPGVTIHVESLPSGKPTGFSGGVGHFELSSKITETDISTNSPVTISIQVKGTGNMKLLKTPAIDWPEGFEVYDPKVSNNFKNTTAGVSGTKNIEYLAIARAAGEYTIPAITFSYFDTEENKYKTLASPEYTIHVARGANESEPAAVVNNYVSKEEIKQLGSDIRYITTGNYTVPQKGLLGDFGNPWWAIFLIIMLLDLLFVFFCRKQIRENADIDRVRYKKANKVAQKRLKTAKKLMANETNKATFYEEIERAALSYLSDRLSIPTSSLNKENIADLLRQKQVDDELIAKVTELLSEAEFARYAPAIAPSMQALYDKTATLIDKLEDTKI
ncbi:MAG: BatD family protein, partial [Paludibacteraceae bacterium]|nr:BatD family protein [Paludibacteraceae bacterium]